MMINSTCLIEATMMTLIMALTIITATMGATAMLVVMGGWPNYGLTTNPAELLALMREVQEFVVDSGAVVDCCPLAFGQEQGQPLGEGDRRLSVLGASGQTIKHHGQRVVFLEVEGKPLAINFEVAEVERPILSVAERLHHGCEVHLAPHRAEIRKGQDLCIPLASRGGLFIRDECAGDWQGGDHRGDATRGSTGLWL